MKFGKNGAERFRQAGWVSRTHHRIGLLVFVTLFGGGSAQAAEFTVTKLTDTNDGSCDSDCSLREAVLEANGLAGEDTIILGAGVHIFSLAGVDEDLAATGDLDLTDDTILMGQGARLTIIDAAALDRVFDIRPGATVEMVGLTVRNGLLVTSGGAGISILGDLTLIACTVTGNQAVGSGFFGGGLAGGPLTLLDSTVSNNVADGGGGGLVIGSPLVMVNTTFSGNRSVNDFGGGIYMFGETIGTADGVTITGNRASMLGGGFQNEGMGNFSFANSVLAGNTVDSGTHADCSGDIASRGYNLLGVNSGCFNFSAMGDQVGTSGNPLDPQLSPLADHGGQTETHRPLSGSPLIDQGNPSTVGSSADACPVQDQRGISRPQDGDGDGFELCDIGAVETRPIFFDGFESGNTASWTLTVGI